LQGAVVQHKLEKSSLNKRYSGNQVAQVITATRQDCRRKWGIERGKEPRKGVL